MQIIKDYQYKERYFKLLKALHKSHRAKLLNYNIAKYGFLTVNNGKHTFLSNVFWPKDDLFS